jgi:hypothetical protein
MTTSRGRVAEGRFVEWLVTANVNAMATDGARIFWSSGSLFPQSCGFPPCSTLNAVPVTGGAPAQLFVADPSSIAAGPVVDASYVYFIVAQKNGPSSLMRMPLSGGPATAVESGAFGAPMALGGGEVVFMEWPQPHQMALARWSTTNTSAAMYSLGDSTWSWVTSIAADDTSVYWLQAGEASPITSLNRTSLDAPANVAFPGGTSIRTSDGAAMAVDDAYIYVKSATIERITKDGGASTTLATTELSQSSLADGTTGLAANGGYVYFSDDGARTIARVPRDGGATTTLAHTGWGVRSIVLDDTSVYWADNVGIGKITPK